MRRVHAADLGISKVEQLVGLRLQYEREYDRQFIVCRDAADIYLKHSTSGFVYSDSPATILDNVRRGRLLVVIGATVPVSLSALAEVLP